MAKFLNTSAANYYLEEIIRLAHDRLILTPHAAFYSEEGLMDMRVKGSENCRRALLGEPLRNVVNAAS